MQYNVVVTSKNEGLSDRIAALVAERLELFYLSFSDLILYNANRPSREAIIEDGGTEWFYRLHHGAASDLAEYENTVIGIAVDDFDYEVYLAVRPRSVLCYVATEGDDTDTDGFDVVVNASERNVGETVKLMTEKICELSRVKN